MVIVHENSSNLSIIAMFSDKYSHNFDIFLEKNLKLSKRGVVIKNVRPKTIIVRDLADKKNCLLLSFFRSQPEKTIYF